MTKFTRDQLIEKVQNTADREILIPSTVFGEVSMVPTSKESLITMLKRKFKENEQTFLKYRTDTKGKRVFIESAQRAADLINKATENTRRASTKQVDAAKENIKKAQAARSQDGQVKRGPGRPRKDIEAAMHA